MTIYGMVERRKANNCIQKRIVHKRLFNENGVKKVISLMLEEVVMEAEVFLVIVKVIL